jgi:hypothetical protein
MNRLGDGLVPDADGHLPTRAPLMQRRRVSYA